ncbi:MAG TPA: crosslink repair DNA glycosylase YcaQ family protein, partial [Chloroflexota bacterium]|nr:crosslink repair DNA glycosylase YcaQ family protein [Chloroflexota bacterium]
EALAELTVRYFTGHGPATIKDFAWWSSLTVTDIRRGLEMVAGQLQRERIEDVEYWSGGSEVPPDSERVHLIHTFDELIVGYSETKHLIDLEGVAAGSETGIYAPSIVVDGQVAGVWKRSMEGHNLRLDLTHYKRLADETSAALGSATERLGRFFGHANPLVAMQYARDDGRPRGP